MQCDNCGNSFMPHDQHFYLVEHEEGTEGILKWVLSDVPRKHFDKIECVSEYIQKGGKVKA